MDTQQDNLPTRIVQADVVNIHPDAVGRLKDQIKLFHEFVNQSLVKDVDYGIISGTRTPSLYKPGSEKLKRLFNLGVREIRCTKDIDWKNGFACITYLVEVYSLKSGVGIAQCEGSANSKERKYGRAQMPDILNSLMKMAWKRAEVGAVISATNASDFFTQDVEDMDMGQTTNAPPRAQETQNRAPSLVDSEKFRPHPEAHSDNTPGYDDRHDAKMEGICSPAQVKRAIAIGYSKGLKPQDVRAFSQLFDKATLEELTKAEMQDLYNHLENTTPKGAA